MANPQTKLQAFRTGAQASGLAKQIFLQGNNGLSPAQLTMVLKQALNLVGIQLPTGALVGLDTLQILFAGGAVAKDIMTGAKIGQCVGDVGTGVSAVADILVLLGVIDPWVADSISLGANISLVVSSGGSNVMADVGVVLSSISLVADLGPNLWGSSQTAQKIALQGLNQQIQALVAPQLKNAAQLLSQYTAGKLDLFDFIGQVAMSDPTQFATLFPRLATFFPSYMRVTLADIGTSKGVFSSKSDEEIATFFVLATSKQQIQDVLVQQYLTTPMQPFESFETIAPVISIQAASVLGLILQSGGNSDVTMDFNFNVIGALRGLGITPSILGDDWLFKGLQRNETDIGDWATHLPYEPITLPYVKPEPSAITINGQSQYTPAETLNNIEASELVSLQTLMQQYDEAGDIESLLQIPEAVAMLERWSSFHVEPAFYSLAQYQADLTDYNSKLSNLNAILQGLGPNDSITRLQITKEIGALVKPTTPVGEITNMKLVGSSITTQNWFSPLMPTDPSTQSGQQFWSYVQANYTLDLSDYWKILNVLSTMQKSNLFQDDTEVQGFQGSITAISTQFQSAYQFVIAKQLNQRARTQVAQGLGIPVDQMGQRYDSKHNLIFYRKKASA